MRKRSTKKILKLKDITLPYKVTFKEGNHDRGKSVWVSMNKKEFTYPVGKEVQLDEKAWEILRNIQLEGRELLPRRTYDPFKDKIYAKS